jgi:hypothetical protein
MDLSHLFTAFILLAGALIVASAGTLALDAAYNDTQERYNASSGSSSTTDSLETGKGLSSTVATLIPLFGYMAVPLGIIGLLLAVGWKSVNSGLSSMGAR